MSKKEVEVPKKKYIGYFLYRILADPLRVLKCYNFKNLSMSEYKVFEKQYTNIDHYIYHGKKVTRYQDKTQKEEKV